MENEQKKNVNEALDNVVSSANDLILKVDELVNVASTNKETEETENTDKKEEKINSEIKEQNNYNSWYKEGVPFLVELKFTHWTPETESKLMRIFMKGEELMDGLEINKLYKAALHSDSLYLEKISDDLSKIKDQVDGYYYDLQKTMTHLVNDYGD